MKKRSLFKRLLSGFVATALAATICFGDRVFEDLFASAEKSDNPLVTVKFVDGGTEKTVEDSTGAEYYVVGALVNKGGSKDLKGDDVVAWACQKIDPYNNASTDVLFGQPGNASSTGTEFRKVGDMVNGRREATKSWANSTDWKVEFAGNENAYDFVTRTYRVWVTENGNPASNVINDPRDIVFPGGFSVTQMFNPTRYYESVSADTIEGYVPSAYPDKTMTSQYARGLDDENKAVTTFTKQNVEFYVNVNFNNSDTKITADDYYYVVVEVDHSSSPDYKTYYYHQLTTEDMTENRVTYTAQKKGLASQWLNGNGNPLTTEQYHGNEPSTKIRLFKANQSRNLKNLIDLSECKELVTGDKALGQKVVIKTQTSEKNADDTLVKYYETINFEKLDPTDNYTNEEIIGGASVFGIVADKFKQKAHMQTNFATNFFDGGDGFRPDLAKNDAGSIYVGEFVTFGENGSSYEVNNNPSIDFEKLQDGSNHPDGYAGTFYSPKAEEMAAGTFGEVKGEGLIKADATTGYITAKNMSAADIKNNVVDPAIQHAQVMSNALAANSANITPIKLADDKYEIDTTGHPDNSTIYIDADELLLAGGVMPKLYISVKEGQNIVFNFKTSDTVNVGEFFLRTLESDGTTWDTGLTGQQETYGGKTYCKSGDVTQKGQDYGSEANDWFYNRVMQSIAFNFNNPTNITIGGTSGLFIVNKADSVTKMTQTTTGWIVSAGYFEKTGGGEWHFPGKVGDYNKPTPTPIVISKRDLDDNTKELPGAQIRITDASKPSSAWENLEIYTTSGGAVKPVKDSDGKSIGMWWKSGDSPREITLAEGTYTFEEFGEPFTYNGKTYDVINQSIEFVVANGKIASKIKTVENENGSKIEHTAKTTDTSDTITISDARTNGPVVYPVHFNKKDITGQNELDGAILRVYKKDGDTETQIGDDWTSVSGAELTLQLEAGTYVLRESQGEAPVAYKDPTTGKVIKTYSVIDSAFEFTVNAQGGIESTSALKKTDFDANATSAYVVVGTQANSTEPLITICDAANTTKVTFTKKDITGSEELKDATLKVYNFDGSKTDGKGTQVGTDWTSTGRATEKMELTLEDGDYLLEESGDNITDASGNTYKVLQDTVKFHVENGVVTSNSKYVKSAVSDVDKTTGGAVLSGTTFTVCDAIRTAKVTITKTDITESEEVHGAKLSLYNYDADKQDNKGTQVGDTWESYKDDNTNVWTVSLAPGQYVLVEEPSSVVTNAGNTVEYQVIKSSYIFTVGTDGKVTETQAVNDDEGTVALVANSNNIKMVDKAKVPELPKFYFNKTDITGDKELANAKLTLTKAGDTSFNESWESKTDKTWEIALADGDYTLTESKSYDDLGNEKKIIDESGYEYTVIGRTVTFTVEDGQIKNCKIGTDDVKTAFTNLNEKGDAVLGTQTGTDRPLITICDAMRELPVSIRKTTSAGSGVENAKFTLTKDGDTSFNKTWTSKYDASTWVINLTPGDYTLTETANGSVKDDSARDVNTASGNYKFRVNKDGTITQIENNITSGGRISIDTDNTTVKVVDDYKYTVNINKTDITGDNELKGATLKLTDEHNNPVKDSNGNDVAEWTSKGTDENWTVTLPDGTYYLKETGNPFFDENTQKTYSVVESTFRFTIEDGRLIETVVVDGQTETDAPRNFVTNADENTKGYFVANGDLFVVCDAVAPADKVFVKISKTDVTGQKTIKNAQLTVTNVGGSFTKSWRSDDASETGILELEDGDYTLTESAAHDAQGNTLNVTDNDGNIYDIVDSTFSFTVENGVVTSTKVVNGTTETNPENAIKADATEGYFYVKGTEFTICDAKRPVPTKTININKKTVSGQDEIKGATLKLTDASGNKVTDANGNEVKDWKSGETTSTWTVTLNDGTYILEETGDKFTDTKTGIEYDVVTSKLKFVIENGEVKSTKVVEGETTSNPATRFNANATEGYYYVNGDTFTVCDAERPIPTKTININKKTVSGQDEIKGATLKLTDASGNKVTDANENEVKDWKSGETTSTWTVTLNDGTYILEETGDKFTDTETGIEYDVVTSKLKFVIENGEVKSTKVVEGETTSNPATRFNANATEGYYYVNGDTFTVCDAERPIPTKTININKKTVSGQDEIKGATLKLTDASGNKVTDANGNEVKDWKSGETTSTWTVTLNDGTYILEETGDKFTDTKTGIEYDVVTSKLKFVIENGEVKSTKVVEGETTSNPATRFNANATEGYYYVNGDTFTVCDAERPIPTKTININKKTVSGQDEIKGATLKLTDASGNKVTDANGNEVKDWKSGETTSTWTVTLNDGTYILEETGDKFTDTKTGIEYDVVTSKLKFVIENGEVKSTKVVEGETTSNPATRFNANATEGYYYVNGDTFTVCDAERVIPKYPVIIDKTDVTGEQELEGAKLTVYKFDSTKEGNKGEKVGTTWTSTKSKTDKFEISLESGDYVLEETGDKVIDGHGNEYKIITSTIKFTVGTDGKVTSTGSKEEFDDVDKDNGGIVIKNDNELTVCDAKKPIPTDVVINKTDVTGEKELANAKLTLTDTKGDYVKDAKSGETIKEWTSNGKDKWTVSLANGTYVLMETGGEFTSGGKTYTVVTSSLEFTVEDGKITSVTAKDKDNKESDSDVKASYDSKSTSGYYHVDDNNITVCDAEKTTSTKPTGQDNGSSTNSGSSGTDVKGQTSPTGSKPSGSDSSSGSSSGTKKTDGTDSTGTKPSGSDSSNGSSSSTKKTDGTDGNGTTTKKSGDNGSSTTTKKSGDNGSSTTTKKSGDNGSTTTTRTGNNGGNTTNSTNSTTPTTNPGGDGTPQTGYAGSTLTVAALLAAVAALAVLKKKDE